MPAGRWFGGAYAMHRIKGNVPAEMTFHTKPQLPAAMLQAIAHEGLLPFKYIVVDYLYGNSPDFLDTVDACVGVTACVAFLRTPAAGFNAPESKTRPTRTVGKFALSEWWPSTSLHAWWRP